MDDVIKLISSVYTKDSLGQEIPTETAREVFASVQSVSRAEWQSAGQNGLRPAFVAVTPLINYAGELTAEWRGKRFTVYRTFFKNETDEIELYLEEKVGS